MVEVFFVSVWMFCRLVFSFFLLFRIVFFRFQDVFFGILWMRLLRFFSICCMDLLLFCGCVGHCFGSFFGLRGVFFLDVFEFFIVNWDMFSECVSYVLLGSGGLFVGGR